MSVMEINSKIQECQKDDELTEQQKTTRLHVLNSELIRLIANDKTNVKLNNLAELKKKIPQANEGINIFRNVETLLDFQYIAEPEMFCDDSTKYFIKSEVADIMTVEKDKIIKMASELDKALGLNDVLYPYNRKNIINDDGDIISHLESKSEDEIQNNYTEAYLKIQELYNQGILDFKTNQIATANILEICDKCSKVSIDNVGLLKKVSNFQILEKERNL